VETEVLEQCSLPGAAVTTTKKAFMTAFLFAKWIDFFASSVPTPVKRPLLLVMDGCASHIAEEIVIVADRVLVKLVCLPANGTHLLQPLDVAVFSSFKNTLHDLIDAVVRANGINTISKEKALQMATLAWTSCNFEQNISSGFRSCGIFPLNLVKMHEKLHNFQSNGVPASLKTASWLKYKETVQHDILLLPARQRKQSRKRKTKTVAGRLLTREMLQQPDQHSEPMTQNQKRNIAKSKRATKKPPTGHEEQKQEHEHDQRVQDQNQEHELELNAEVRAHQSSQAETVLYVARL
jgi:hypothetical protein